MYTLEGWPQFKEDVQLAARDLFAIRGELSVVDGILLKGDRIAVPYNMRQYILGKIHDGHMGVVKCKERARQAVWWPGITRDICNTVAACKHCVEKQPQQSRQPLLTTELPGRPFQKVATDLCQRKGKNYLVYVDYYSRWIDIHPISGKVTAAAVIDKLKTSFTSSGIPEELISDNGPQFKNAEFQKFAKDWNFIHTTSSPHYHQSNGEAERAVRTAKEMLSQKDYKLALLSYRATPLPSLGVSPAQLALGRQLRTTLPVAPAKLQPHTVEPDVVKSRDSVYKAKTKAYHDTPGARLLPELQPGDPVLLNEDKAWQRPGVVSSQCAPRSYLVQTSDGERRRNRQHLRRDTIRSQPNNAAAAPPAAEKSTVPAQSTKPEAVIQLPVATEARASADPSDPLRGPIQDRPPDTGYTTRSGRHVTKPARFRDGVQ